MCYRGCIIVIFIYLFTGHHLLYLLEQPFTNDHVNCELVDVNKEGLMVSRNVLFQKLIWMLQILLGKIGILIGIYLYY